jgi:hypothetical protein
MNRNGLEYIDSVPKMQTQTFNLHSVPNTQKICRESPERGPPPGQALHHPALPRLHHRTREPQGHPCFSATLPSPAGRLHRVLGFRLIGSRDHVIKGRIGHKPPPIPGLVLSCPSRSSLSTAGAPPAELLLQCVTRSPLST